MPDPDSSRHATATGGAFTLPESVRQGLARREVRLHHLLWHAIRNSWHDITEPERRTFAASHPAWVPAQPRFIRTPTGVQPNPDAGEAFLYMHRLMLEALRADLATSGADPLRPWTRIPDVADPDYPVPGRDPLAAPGDPKSDATLARLRQFATRVLDPTVLRRNSLAAVGAFVETAIHDVMHMRWAALDPGPMATFPALGALNVRPVIDPRYDDSAVDWLGHPYSSHVNSVFWMLHGWCDAVIDAWLAARGLGSVQWTDTWIGDMPSHAHHGHAGPLVAMRAIEPGAAASLERVLDAVGRLSVCHVGFDYAARHGLPPLTL